MPARKHADPETITRILRSAAVLSDAGRDDLAELARVGRTVIAPRGRALAAPPGGPSVFFVQRGVVADLLSSPGGAEPILVTLAGPGDVVGLLSLFTEKAVKGTERRWAEALTEVAAFAVPVADLIRLCRRDTELLVAFASAIARQETRISERLARSLHDSLEMRVAAIVSEIAEKVASDDWNPMVNIGRLPQSVIASMLGVSREHVNRTFAMWERSGLIFQNARNDVVVQDARRLRRISAVCSDDDGGDEKDEWLRDIDVHLDRGLNQGALHLALEAARRSPKEARYAHRAALATARMGALSEALALVEKHKLNRNPALEDLACLRPRLLRDLAFEQDGAAPDQELLAASAAEYEEIFRASGGFYSGINAAGGHALSGSADKARAIAREVTSLLLADADAEDEYWRRTTLAECKLLEGDSAAASSLFEAAATAANATPGKKATTRKQLRRLATAANMDMAWIDRVMPQANVMYFCGPLARGRDARDLPGDDIVASLEAMLRRCRIGWAYGALASGADIIAAETLLRAGVDLHVYLPLAPAEFMKSSVYVSGADWRDRFTACMRAAASIEWNRCAFEPCDAVYRLGAEVAMGKAARRARELETEAVGFFATPAGEAADGAHTMANLARWKECGLTFVEAPGRWPAKDPHVAAASNNIPLFAVVIEGAIPDTRRADHHFKSRTGNLAALLFRRFGDALECARTLSTNGAECRCWLDIGVFSEEMLAGAFEEIAPRLIAAACRPSTEIGKVYASETFACVAALASPRASFEYIGFSATREKVDPCALSLVRFKP